MELFTHVKKVLKDREITILSMEKKLNYASALNRTLLQSLSSVIGSSDLLSYDERQAIRQETKDLCDGIDFQINDLDRAVELE